MSPEELAQRHPRLYHLTHPDAGPLIKKLGLQSTTSLLKHFGCSDEQVFERTARLRKQDVRIECPEHGTAYLSNNTPINLKKLQTCLDDGLSVQDWLRILNDRVFFWVSPKKTNALRESAENRGKQRLLLTFNTHALANAVQDRLELCPFNSGSTYHVPPRRGVSTFTPISDLTYRQWQQKRSHVKKSPDQIVEVAVRGPITNVDQFCVSIEIV